MKSKENKSKREQLGMFINDRVIMIQRAYLSPMSRSKGSKQLAALCRAATKAPGEIAETWQLEFEGLPMCLVGKKDEPSEGERAVHAALTLYAIHQRSQTTPMYRSEYENGLGQAIRSLVLYDADRYTNLEQGELPRRFSALVTAESFSETVYYARQLVGQLRGAAIPLDYALLAQQFYDLQMPDRAGSVKLAWGRGFAMYREVAGSDQEYNPSNVNS